MSNLLARVHIFGETVIAIYFFESDLSEISPYLRKMFVFFKNSLGHFSNGPPYVMVKCLNSLFVKVNFTSSFWGNVLVTHIEGYMYYYSHRIYLGVMSWFLIYAGTPIVTAIQTSYF